MMTKQQVLDWLEVALSGHEREAERRRAYIELCIRAGAHAASPAVWSTRRCLTHNVSDDLVMQMSWSERNTEQLLCGCLQAHDIDACKIARQVLREMPE